jgi:hypothetical protein
MSGQRIFRDLITSGRHKGRPKCVVEGCKSPGQDVGTTRKDGSKIYRKKCSSHHFAQYGMGDFIYKKHRVDFCENIDGRLGFKCTSTIFDMCQLDTDHINNNHNDNRKCNLQTLCRTCHPLKGKWYGHIRSLSYLKKIFSKNRALPNLGTLPKLD